MIDYSVDTLMEKTKNKYVLSQVIAKRAREIRSEEGFVLGYKAIDQAAQELVDDRYSYTFEREEDEE
ncbi:MAG TPA: DNA-directed RNA polymerase subunit omega [Tissierellia bacterium]|jgi:DNA-directed RNA polymerase omega subunit|nr:DNA-directed RNA polymerase subunit omega [Tissierellia bacterium]